MSDTPILDGLRARARPIVIGKMVIELTPAQGSALDREINLLGVTIPNISVVRWPRWSEVEIDGAAIVWRNG
jgi:hypothetical protein